MAKDILVYEIYGYADDGGGTYIEYPKDKDDMIKIVNRLSKENKDKFQILCAGWLQIEYEIKPITYITEFEID